MRRQVWCAPRPTSMAASSRRCSRSPTESRHSSNNACRHVRPCGLVPRDAKIASYARRLATSGAPVGLSHGTPRSSATRGGSPPPAPPWARPTGRQDRRLRAAARHLRRPRGLAPRDAKIVGYARRLATSGAPVGLSHGTPRSSAMRGGACRHERPARVAGTRAPPPTAPPSGLREPSPIKPTKTCLGRALGRPSFSPMFGGVCGHRTGPMALFRVDGCASVEVTSSSNAMLGETPRPIGAPHYGFRQRGSNRCVFFSGSAAARRLGRILDGGLCLGGCSRS